MHCFLRNKVWGGYTLFLLLHAVMDQLHTFVAKRDMSQIRAFLGIFYSRLLAHKIPIHYHLGLVTVPIYVSLSRYSMLTGSFVHCNNHMHNLLIKYVHHSLL